MVLPANSGCFGQFWVWPREFYIRRVRCYVLPVSCVFRLLSFIGFHRLLFVFLCVVCSRAVAVYFGRYFGENFADIVGVRCWVCCVVDFLDQVGWFHCQQYPLGMFWVRLCRSSFSNRSVTWQFCQMNWGCSIAQVCARVAYCLGSP